MRILLLLPVGFLPSVLAACYDVSPAFPVPTWWHGAKRLHLTLQSIEDKIEQLIGAQYNTTSFSVELTSATETLWSIHHTAKVLNKTRPGDTHVDGDSLYRIASITKLFTTQAILQLQDEGQLNIEDPVTRYVSELKDDAAVPWKDITLRILASQLSGIPREFAQSDLLGEESDPVSIGLPPAPKDSIPDCDLAGSWLPCNRSQFFEFLNNDAQPLFAPNQRSTYGNVNFELLGQVIESVSGKHYSTYIHEHIFKPLNMTSSTLTKPASDDHAVLPAIGWNYWDVDEGVLSPTGGIYSSAKDMSKYLRYVLTHYNTLATGVNWLMPASWTPSMGGFYGMPWEIFRTDRILPNTQRPVTFTCKSGGLPGYVSRVVVMEEYGLGLTVLVGGDGDLLEKLLEIVTVGLLPAAEKLIWEDVKHTYAGSFQAVDYPSLNSSLTLKSTEADGLVLTSFISNGTDVFQGLLKGQFGSPGEWKMQLSPTLLYKDEEAQQGEIWMAVQTKVRKGGAVPTVWDDSCITDVDTMRYAGKRINEIVFWHEEEVIELPGWKVKMRRVEKDIRTVQPASEL